MEEHSFRRSTTIEVVSSYTGDATGHSETTSELLSTGITSSQTETQKQLREIPYAHGPVPESESEPAPGPAAAQETPTGLQYVIKIAVGTVIMSMLYVPFLLAVLLQSAWTRKAFPTVEWETKLKRPSWYVAIPVFLLLLAGPSFVFLIPDNFTVLAVAIYYVPIFLFHTLILDYANSLPEMQTLEIFTEVDWKKPSTVWALIQPFIEAYQIVALARTMELPSMWQKVFAVSLLDFNFFDARIGAYIGLSVVLLYWALIGFAIATEMSSSSLLAGIVFDVVPGLLFLPVVNSQLRLFQAGGSAVLLFFALLGFLFFTATAPFVGTYRSNELNQNQIRFSPICKVIDRSVKSLAAVFATIFSVYGATFVRILLLALLLSCLLLFLVLKQSCSWPRLCTIRVITLSIGVWYAFSSILAVGLHSTRALWISLCAWPVFAAILAFAQIKIARQASSPGEKHSVASVAVVEA